MRKVYLDPESKKNLLENLLKRSPNQYESYAQSVNEIVSNVKNKGDEALFAYTAQFDKAMVSEDNVLVTEEETAEAYRQVPEELLAVIRKALVNIREYHEKQRQYSWFDSRPDGSILGQKVTALRKVGVYVPGGKAAYPSSVLMNVVPAKVAGVEQIIMTSRKGRQSESGHAGRGQRSRSGCGV